jgi:threonine dehydrogenase-like Zn-dependent dehydrogenase
MFSKNVGLAGGMAPVRTYLPHLLDLTLSGAIDPGRVFDLTLPLDEVAEGYRAMDERRAIKVLIEP